MSSITYFPAPPGQDGNFFGGFGGADSYEGGVSVSPPAASARESSSSSSSTGVSNSVVIIVIVFSITVIVSISLCFLIRLLSGRRARRPEADEESGGRGRAVASRRVQPVNVEHQQQQELEVNNALPLFTFESAKKNGGGGGEEAVAESDCAICLSKFEPSDHLRLLPICCHAFHAECVDLWLESNQSCPLCRSAIFASEAEILQKVLTASSTPTLRLEVSSIPHHQPDPQQARSFSTGSHDHLIPQPAAQLGSGSLARAQSEDKMDHSNNTLAAERSWLRDYMERLSSRTASFRSSGRYFTGSSRRSEMTLPGDGYWDVEASRAGEEISEMFRWFSGI
uniref:RING-type domain-containing protein n=1 Tax=Kalanchoe fedtschenkoi TaxID=63787 RepID=A0A7N0V7B8_KALFE